MTVVLLNHTPEPEMAVALAARVCYSPLSVTELHQELTEDEVGRLLAFLSRAGHTSTFEHASFTFGIEGSRAALNQLVRHRIASYSQQSQRYVTADELLYVTPPAIAAADEAQRLFHEAMHQAHRAYAALLEMGMAKEDARYVLPGGALSRLVATFNARSLLNLFALRCCERAQWEIRHIAQEMLAAVRGVAPRLFAEAGPPCETQGVCREGALSCGRLAGIKRRARAGEGAGSVGH